MTSHILSHELGNIVQEAKKKHGEIRMSAEKSLSDLKALPSTSEAQLAADLRRRPHFITPFLQACKVGQTKLALAATICLQRLIVSGGLAPDRLHECLQAFNDCSKTGLDVQLKILQSLPSLLQGYSASLQGDLQSEFFQLCTTLQQVKNAAVSNTASATLQQLVTSVFERLETEDAAADSHVETVLLELDGRSINVSSVAHDAYRLFQDLCLLTGSQRPLFIRDASIPRAFGLELLEAILTTHGDIFDEHPEQVHILCHRVVPLVTHLLSERNTFAVSVRTMRIMCILLRDHLSTLRGEIEIPLGLLNHILDAEADTPWRRALCMETFKMIYSTNNIALQIYANFDKDPERRSIIQENLAHFVRLAAERPALIGISQQSTFPTGITKNAAQEQAMLEANVAGIISSEPGVTEINVPGISTELSTLKVACLDLLDKHEAPQIPETYIYSLVLTCINNLSDGLAKTILPLTIKTRVKRGQTSVEEDQESIDSSTEDSHGINGQKDSIPSARASAKTRWKDPPLNPLELQHHKSHHIIRAVADLINDCWPAILATSSTFLYAALDADFYRSLIRSIQRIAQVAGILRMSTPQDALMTTLAKAAIPSNIRQTNALLSPTPSTITSPKIGSSSGGLTSVDGFFGQSAQDGGSLKLRRTSLEIQSPTLNQRNLMCLRALLNLAIALGPILGQSWTIIIETLQKADSILALLGTAVTARDYRPGETERQTADGVTSLSSEIAAVESAVTRLFQTTADYTNEAFLHVAKGLGELLSETPEVELAATPTTPKIQRRAPSVAMGTFTPQARNRHFAISKLGDLLRINVERLAYEPAEGGWVLCTKLLRDVAISSTHDGNSRLMACEYLGKVAIGVATVTLSEEREVRAKAQQRAVGCLEDEILSLYDNITRRQEHTSTSSVDVDVHRSALEALHAILEQCGQAMVAGWLTTFNIINSTFDQALAASDPSIGMNNFRRNHTTKDFTSLPPSPKLVRSAFTSVQLICSDFLSHIPSYRIMVLINMISQFCTQSADLNISLTAVTLFWNLSDFLLNTIGHDDCLKSKDKILQSIEAVDKRGVARDAVLPLPIFMILQARLATLTNDPRVELRNALVSTIYRVLDNANETLSAAATVWCLRNVALEILHTHIQDQEFERHYSGQNTTTDRKDLNTTTKVIMSGLVSYIAARLDIIAADADFVQIWRSMIAELESLLLSGDSLVSAIVFDGLGHLFSATDSALMLSQSALLEIIQLWINVPKYDSARSMEDPTAIEQSSIALAKSFQNIHALTREFIAVEDLKKFTWRVLAFVENASKSAYTSDVDNTTEMQTQALDCLQDMSRQDILPTFFDVFGRFILLPYSHNDNKSSRLTYVAFAKASMKLIQEITMSSVRTAYDSATVLSMYSYLQNLVKVSDRKYEWSLQGKEPSMWRCAEAACVSFLQEVLPALAETEHVSSVGEGLWKPLIQAFQSIAAPRRELYPSDNSILLSDETFDMNLLRRITTIIRTEIHVTEHCDTEVSTIAAKAKFENASDDSIKAAYVAALFNGSLIHDVNRLNIKSALNVESHELGNLYKVRPGSTYDPTFNARIRMCYENFDELFASASSAHKHGATRNSKLAAITFPALILRCAMPLKRYIADQPLRGRMPTPQSQRLELLYMLDKVAELKCDIDVKMCEALCRSSKNESRSHLMYLMPLINMASRHARDDDELADALQEVVEASFRV